jgi:hypothetical protein
MPYFFGKLVLDGLNLGYDIANAGTFVTILQQCHSTGSSARISYQSVVALVLFRCLHFINHFFSNYSMPLLIPQALPLIVDFVGAALAIFCACFLLQRRLLQTYEQDKDDFGIQVFERLNCRPTVGLLRHRPIAGASLFYCVVALSAVVWYSVQGSGRPSLVGYSSSFCDVLGAMALLPQIWMFHKEKRAPSHLATTVLLVVGSRMCIISHIIVRPLVYGRTLILSMFVQHLCSETMFILIFADFLFFFARSKARGDKEIILEMDSFV